MDEEIVLGLLLLLEDDEKNKKDFNREHWVRPLLMNREICGAFHTTFQEVLSDPIECRGYIRVDGTQFNYLLEHLSPILQKEDTNTRKCIDPAERICLTLRYLATGESFHSLEYQFPINIGCVCKIR